MVTVRIPTALRTYAANQASIDVDAATVGDAIARVVKTHPDLASHLYEESGALRSFVNVYLADKDVRTLQGMDTPVSEGDRVLIVPSVAGGRA